MYGIYPHWTSQAYVGLFDLRLANSAMTITESQLVNILTSSPRLRVLCFSPQITDPLPAGSQIVPLRLDNLEVLNLQLMAYEQRDILLRWLAPGPNPLQLCLQAYPRLTESMPPHG